MKLDSRGVVDGSATDSIRQRCAGFLSIGAINLPLVKSEKARC